MLASSDFSGMLYSLSLIGAGHEVVRRRGKRLNWLRMSQIERYRVSLCPPFSIADLLSDNTGLLFLCLSPAHVTIEQVWTILVLYALVLLAGLLSMRTDDYLSATLKSSSGTYKATAGDAIGFWTAMAYLRAVCALLAWLLVISVRLALFTTFSPPCSLRCGNYVSLPFSLYSDMVMTQTPVSKPVSAHDDAKRSGATTPDTPGALSPTVST